MTTDSSKAADRPHILALFGSILLFGQERGNIEALSGLQESGYRVRCIVRSDRWGRAVVAELEARGIEHVKAPYIDLWRKGRRLHFIFRNPFVFAAAQAVFLYHYFRFRPSRLYAFNPSYLANFLIGLMLVRAPLLYRAGDEPTLHGRSWRFVWKLMKRRIDHVVANSQFVKRAWVTAGMESERISLIYNRPSRRPSRAVGSDQNLAVRHTGLSFVFLGQLTPEKGVDLLIGAFQALIAGGADANLLIAGEMDDRNIAWSTALRTAIEADPAARERIHLVGYVHDVERLLSLADVHVAPSAWNEPLGGVVIEAKAARRPSIVFPNGGLPEIVRHETDGLICAETSLDALRLAMQYYVDDPASAVAHGEAAFSSLRLLESDRFVERWAEVAKRVSSARTRPQLRPAHRGRN